MLEILIDAVSRITIRKYDEKAPTFIDWLFDNENSDSKGSKQ